MFAMFLFTSQNHQKLMCEENVFMT